MKQHDLFWPFISDSINIRKEWVSSLLLRSEKWTRNHEHKSCNLCMKIIVVSCKVEGKKLVFHAEYCVMFCYISQYEIFSCPVVVNRNILFMVHVCCAVHFHALLVNSTQLYVLPERLFEFSNAHTQCGGYIQLTVARSLCLCHSYRDPGGNNVYWQTQRLWDHTPS